MGVFHYLNVKEGDCSIIQHPSGHVTVIDVSNASIEEENDLKKLERKIEAGLQETFGKPGNFNQKSLPVNPIEYLRKFDVDHIFRFILTHPDMDHMSGIEDLFKVFSPTNFWDTNNKCEKEFEDDSPYNPEDWKFYKKLRDSNPKHDPKRLVLYSNSKGQYYNQFEDGTGGGDGLHILAPTEELIEEANESDDYNDASYVVLYRVNNHKILFAGDSHDDTWNHILSKHKKSVTDVDILIAPHHGRDSGMSFDFLDIVNPVLTFFGNAPSKDLAYGAWQKRNLPIITNNQANCMIIDADVSPMKLYVTNKKFAEAINKDTIYSKKFDAYFVTKIIR